MSEYREESDALDTDLLAVMHAWHKHGTGLSEPDFNHLALRVFAYQLRYNEPYACYCASLGINAKALPKSWESIPPVPAAAFKDATLATFDPALAQLCFETSGTTQGRGGVHYMENAALYDTALLAGFDRAMLADNARLRYFNVVPNPNERPESSLGYMMAKVSAERGDGQTGWYVNEDALLINAFAADLRAAIEQDVAVCIAGTAFGLLGLLDQFAARNERFVLPTGSRIMETGGFKGRTRAIARHELYEKLALHFHLQPVDIFSEYGMTELTSQFYDSPETRGGQRPLKVAPPWLRARVVDPAGKTVAPGIVGALVHVDLANRSSVLSISTEDLGSALEGGLFLFGRDEGAELRGCSLDAEDLSRARM